jgi:DNA-binding NarL/FixJ family response regulator
VKADSVRTRPQILFADDHCLILDALRQVASPEYEVKTATTIAELQQAVAADNPDIAILDIRMPDGNGVEAARHLLQKRPDLKILFLSMHTEPEYVRLSCEAGAKGYLCKRTPLRELLQAIRVVLDGGTYFPNLREGRQSENATGNALTERQTEVLRLIAQGMSAKEIAVKLNISVRTAEFHRAAIMERLDLHSTAMMTRYAVDRGLVVE